MNVLEASNLAVRNVTRRKLRSWLTIIGIFIGIAAVVSLISISQGLKGAIEGQFSSIGADKLFISIKSFGFISTAATLTKDDVDAIEKVNGVKVVSGQLFKAANVEFKGEIQPKLITSFPEKSEERNLIAQTNLLEIEQGRTVRKGDEFKVVVGNDIAHKNVFKEKVSLNDKMLINGQKFTVVGVLKKATPDIDRIHFFVDEDFMREFFDEPDEVGFISAQVAQGEDVSKVAEDVKRELRKERNLDEGDEDFEVQTPEQILESLNIVLNIVQAVLIGIAAISLLVGGIGITNTMYTAVLERTSEIGVMKAIGARNNDVLLIFIIESGLLGLVGGVIGVLLGIGGAKIVEMIATNLVGPNILLITFSPYLIAGALMFSFIVGSISGVLPARQASRLHVVDALRYE